MQRYLEDQATLIEEALAAHALPGRVAGGSLSPRLIHYQWALPAGLRLARLTPALPAPAAGLGVEAAGGAPRPSRATLCPAAASHRALIPDP